MKIVGIGASAGGIEAFKLFFRNMPADTGLGLVLVLHLSPNRKSLLPEIIARWTAMEVVEAEEGMPVLPNRVHIIPPGHLAMMSGGRLRLRSHIQREIAPIDEFFDSLALDQGPNAIGIILSGAGHDGALGLKAIKAKGGLTMVQGTDLTEPTYHDMPDSAIATGAVDIIVPVQNMPERLSAMLAIDAINTNHETGANGANAPDAAATQEAERLHICGILRERLGHDFSHYKEKTFLRRVQRRMQALGIADIAAYIHRLQNGQDEAVLLFRDLLIGVTTFFRDVEAFDAVKRVVLPKLFAGKGPKDHLRVWVPGCATGEEAYSLAMLLREQIDQTPGAPTVQVFATDIDEAAIATARAGRYPASLVEGISPERKERFFLRQDNSYAVVKELRELCTFSAHSLVRDPPFSRMDMVSCRNLLIYLDPELQAAVIPAFHFSLSPGGVLLLGSSETVSRHEHLFAPLDGRHRIYQRRDVPSPPLTLPSRVAAPHHLPGTERLDPVPRRLDASRGWPRALAQANARVLERYAAPFVIVNEDGLIAHYSSHVGQFLQPALGAPSQSLFDMIRPGLRPGTRAVLREAVQSAGPVERNVTYDDAQGPRTVRLVAEPLPGEDVNRPYLVVLAEIPKQKPRGSPTGENKSSLATELEQELREAYQRLQLLTEEHEASLEELRSANEELQSVNEELQSTNEEMATSKEEIQSVSEEMQTVNAQLSMKVDELDRANNDLRNLFESTQVATVFLDRHLIIRSFTPEMAHIYNLIPSDRGRPLPDIVGRLDYTTLREDVARVLERLKPVEQRVSDREGTVHYLMRILPYRAPDSTVDGALITFVNVTGIVEAEQQQRLLVDELNHRVKNMLGIVASLAKQTLQRSSSLEVFSEAFLGRIHALSAAYALVSRHNWNRIELRDLIEQKLQAFASSEKPQVDIQGPLVLLDANAALAMGLTLYELCTNAAKYGALSVPEGQVSVHWDIEHCGEVDRLHLEWIEQGGPRVSPPKKAGFGTQLIERSLVHSLSGEARLDFLPEGLRATLKAELPCSMQAPAERLTEA